MAVYQNKYRFVLFKDNEIGFFPKIYVGNDSDLFYLTYQMLWACMSSGIVNVGLLGIHALIKTMLLLFISFLEPFVGMAPEPVTYSFGKRQNHSEL